MSSSIGSLVPGVERIAVLRANALGDLVFALPALDALRASYPGARITLLGRAWQRELLRDRPNPVDEVVPVAGDGRPPTGDSGEAPWLAATPVERAAFVGAMRRRRFDVAIQLHGGGRNSNPLVASLGARVTAGTHTPDAPALMRSIPYVYYQQETARCLEVVGLVGAVPHTLAPRMGVTPADHVAARQALGGDIRPYAVIHGGASDPRRRWAADRFARLADALSERGLHVVLSGSSEELAIGAAIASRTRAPVLDLTGQTGLPALLGLLADASLVVSNDTGPMHLAVAVGTPSVGIYWIGNLVNGGPLTRATHRPVVAWRTRCPACGADCVTDACDHRVSFLGDVPCAAVIEAVEEVIGKKGVRAGTSDALEMGGGAVRTARRRA